MAIQYSTRLKEVVEDLYYDQIEGKNIDRQLNRVFELVLKKQIVYNDTMVCSRRKKQTIKRMEM